MSEQPHSKIWVAAIDHRLLAALEELGPTSRASLARRTEMDRSDVAAAINELAAQNLAERVTDQKDRRRIPPAGKKTGDDR